MVDWWDGGMVGWWDGGIGEWWDARGLPGQDAFGHDFVLISIFWALTRPTNAQFENRSRLSSPPAAPRPPTSPF
jgi:hypothetical protein